MIKIGVVNIDTSHPPEFARIYREGDRARYTSVYNDGFRTDDEVKAFMSKSGIEKRHDTIESMAQDVDIGFIQSCNWDKHIEQAIPFIKAGKPVFIDKPIVGNLKDCLRLEELAADGAVILGTSALRYCAQIQEFQKRPIEDRGEIISIMGTCGVDEFNYGIHTSEGMAGMIGEGIVSVKFVSSATVQENVANQYIVQWSGSAIGVLQLLTGIWAPWAYLVTTTKNVFVIEPDREALYRPMLDAICDYMEHEKTMAPVPALTEVVKAHLAAKKSRQNGGETVHISDLSIDDPGFDGYAFEKQYAASKRTSTA